MDGGMSHLHARMGMGAGDHHGRGAGGPGGERDQFQNMLKNLIDIKESKRMNQIPPSVFDTSSFKPIAPVVEKVKDAK